MRRAATMSSQPVSTYTFQQLESAAGADQTPADALARARSEADAIRSQARAEGEAAGYAAGLDRAREHVTMALAALAQATQEVNATREELARVLTAQAGDLALLTAQQIIAGTIAVQPERVIDVVRAALRRLTDRHQVTVLVNPEDLELLTGAAQSLRAELGGIEHLDIQADRRVARGGAVAQTAHGEIDATVQAQLLTARELLTETLSGAGHETERDSGDTPDWLEADAVPA